MKYINEKERLREKWKTKLNDSCFGFYTTLDYEKLCIWINLYIRMNSNKLSDISVKMISEVEENIGGDITASVASSCIVFVPS